MKYYAHIVNCSSDRYWYKNLIGEFILIDNQEQIDKYGNKYYEVTELNEEQLKTFTQNNNVVGYTLDSNDIKVYNDRILKIQKIIK